MTIIIIKNVSCLTSFVVTLLFFTSNVLLPTTSSSSSFTTTTTTSSVSPSDIDVFLRRMYGTRPDNCSMEMLGPGVVQGLARDRFKRQALIAVTRANLLTYLWKYNPDYLYRESVLYWLVSNLVESDDDIFAAGNCYDFNQFKSFGIFCPYAFRNKKDETIIVKDLAKTHHYENENNEHEWFHEIRRIGLRIINNTKTTRKESVVNFFLPNEETNKTYSTLVVNYDDGHWSMPYYDCGGGNIWMITYTVPFFGYDRLQRSYSFKGTSGIDIDLMQVDINQCSPSELNQLTGDVNVFANTHKCKPSTHCLPIAGLGFHRGSYKCFCREGFYFPMEQRNQYDDNLKSYYFNGSELEESYDRKQDGEDDGYDTAYECLPCAPGCDTCEDSRPCLYPINWVLRIVLLSITVLVMVSTVGWSILVRMFQDFKAIKAASPLLLQIILGGALISYTPMIVHFFEPHPVLCTLQFWPREIGFAIIYASILFKTWRIAVVFRPTKYRNVRITDVMLLRRIGMVVLAFCAFCVVRTIIGRPEVVMVRHSSGMKTFTCNFDVWDFSVDMCKLVCLIWGIWLSILVHNTPSEFNESRFISWAIYNETIMTVFFNVSMFFLHNSGNPDLFYILVFLHSQLTVTGTIAFLFASKAYHLVKSIRAGETRQSQKRGRFVPALTSRTSTVTAQTLHPNGPRRNNSVVSTEVPSCEVDGLMNGHNVMPPTVALGHSSSNNNSSTPETAEPVKRRETLEKAEKPPLPPRDKDSSDQTEEEKLLLPRLTELQQQIESLRNEVVTRTKASPQSSINTSSDISAKVQQVEKSLSTPFELRAPFVPPSSNHNMIAKTLEVHLGLNADNNGVMVASTSQSDSSCKSPSSGTNTLSSTHSTKTTDDASVGNKPMDESSSLLIVPSDDSNTPSPGKLSDTSRTAPNAGLLVLPNGMTPPSLHNGHNGHNLSKCESLDNNNVVRTKDGVHLENNNGYGILDESVVSPDDPAALPINHHRRSSGGQARLWLKRNGKAEGQAAHLHPNTANGKTHVVENEQQNQKNVVNVLQFTYV